MSRTARAWSGLNAVVVLVALGIQIPITAANEGGFFVTPASRVANLFTFFTILTNLLVAAVSVLLAVGPDRRDRRDTLFRTLRLDALLGIALTGIVYHTLLAGLNDFRGAEHVADVLWHTVSPILAVLGWVLFGPRARIDPRVVAWSVAYPLAWLGFALVRGAIIGWYPYPFVDVLVLGYPQVALNCLGITVLFLVLAAAAMGIDRLLDRSARAVLPAR